MSALPVTAPRGKEYAVARFGAAIGDGGASVSADRWTDLAAAEQVRGSIDYRLSPFIIIVDKDRSS